HITILGIGSSDAGHTKGCVTITLKSQHSNQSLTLQAHILGGLTNKLPATTVSSADVAHFSDLTLADPYFTSPVPGLLANNTIFGWIILGPVQAQCTHPSRTHHAVSNHHDQDLQDLLTRFWLQEEVMSNHSRSLSPDEEACEAHFKDTHTRDSSGRYIVRLPLISSPSQLGNSYTAARRCLQHLMRRLDHDPRLKTLYINFMEEYLRLKHMQPASTNSSASQYFLPHHGVLKEDNNKCKIRVVFNGSKPTSSGLSLNDIMHTGPKLQVNIFDVLITSRQHRFIFITDVTKMYRQIQVQEDDQDLQQILWFDEQGNIVPFKLTTVTYGTKSAPYLAVRALLQLVEDDGHRFPQAIIPLTKGRLCTAGGFPLAKWASNHRKLRQLNCAEAVKQYKIEDPEVSTKILGMYWSSHKDHFSFKHSPPCSTQPYTKRAILSEIAQIFDPLGFLSPLIIQAKMFMQELWLVKLGW
ncbi:GSCOCG00012021001-RA-CDS, partial [Cotesia congregata]